MALRRALSRRRFGFDPHSLDKSPCLVLSLDYDAFALIEAQFALAQACLELTGEAPGVSFPEPLADQLQVTLHFFGVIAASDDPKKPLYDEDGTRIPAFGDTRLPSLTTPRVLLPASVATPVTVEASWAGARCWVPVRAYVARSDGGSSSRILAETQRAASASPDSSRVRCSPGRGARPRCTANRRPSWVLPGFPAGATPGILALPFHQPDRFADMTRIRSDSGVARMTPQQSLRRLLPAVPVAVVATVALVVAAPATAAAEDRCDAKRSRTEEASRYARVCSVRRAQDDAVTRRWYACLYRTERRVHLGDVGPAGMFNDRISPVRLAGRYVATAEEYTASSGDALGAVIQVRDLRRGALVHRFQSPGDHNTYDVTDLELRANGSVAWIARNCSGNAGHHQL